MIKLTIEPQWQFRDEAGQKVDLRLFELLWAINETGKLTDSAARVGVSYRHAWNLIRQWSDFFGHPLVSMRRGRGAELTTLGDRLLWAERRVTARVGPQLESLATEINAEINRVLPDQGGTIRIHASHGFAIAGLPALAREADICDIELQFSGSLDSLRSLNQSQCDLAGFHVPDGELNASIIADYAQWLKPDSQSLIQLAIRSQGLMLRQGNPRNIHAIEDLIRSDVTFVNRQRSSGTRTLLNLLLEARGLSGSQVNGFGNEEFTHAAVAAYVASGMADAGLGVEPAARQFGLDFIPVASEHYFLICDDMTLESDKVNALVELIRSQAYQQMIEDLPGYDASEAGTVSRVRDTFKWLPHT